MDTVHFKMLLILFEGIESDLASMTMSALGTFHHNVLMKFKDVVLCIIRTGRHIHANSRITLDDHLNRFGSDDL